MASRISYVAAGVAIGAVAATVGSQISLPPRGSALAASAETYRQLNLLGDILEKVRSQYVESPDEAAHFIRSGACGAYGIILFL